MSDSRPRRRLAVLITHPIQYFRPVFAELAADPRVDLLVVFGCDHGLRARVDPDFGVSFAWDCSPTKGFEHIFVSQRPLSDLSRWSVALPLAWAAWRRIRAFSPDVVLVFAYSPAWITFTTLLLSSSGHTLFLRADGTDRAFPASRFKRLLKDWILRCWYRQFLHIFPIGSDSDDHFGRLGVPDHCRTPVRYAVDVDFFAGQLSLWSPKRSRLRDQYNIQKSELVLLWTAKMTSVKNPGLLLQALDLLPQHVRERFVLIAVGDGPLRTSFERDALRSLGSRCHFTGFQNQQQLGAYYAMADVLVFPSCQGETWGLVVNEALQFGLAVIGSDHVGSVHDLLGSSGSAPFGSAVFPSKNAMALAASIERFAFLYPDGFTPRPVPALPHPRDLAGEISRQL